MAWAALCQSGQGVDWGTETGHSVFSRCPVLLEMTKAGCGLKFYELSLLRFSKIFESLPCFGFGEMWCIVELYEWNLNVLGKMLDKLLMCLGECEKGGN